MNCPKCDTNTDSSGQFCSSCGVRLAAAVPLIPGEVSYESLEAMFRANDWIVLKDDDERDFRVEFKDSYLYYVRIQQGRRIAMSSYWRMSETESLTILREVANQINMATSSSITAILERKDGAVDAVVTIPVLLDSSLLFSDLSRFVLFAEKEWDISSSNASFSNYLYSSN